MIYVTLTTGASGSVTIQDPFPAEGHCVFDIPPSKTRVIALTDAQYNHIRPALDRFLVLGALTSVLVNESEEARTDLFLETRKTAGPPAVRPDFGRFYTGLDNKPRFIGPDGIDYDLSAVSGGYTPGTPADWAAPAPSSVQAALDRLASALTAHLGTPIP